MPSVKQGGIKYHFWVFCMTRPGIETQVYQAIGEHSKHYANVNSYSFWSISSFLSRGIILWIELPENPANTYERHTETLDGCFDLIRSHQQYIPWSPPLGQSGPENNGNKGLLHIFQSSRTEAPPSDSFVSYRGYSLKWSISYVETLLEYFKPSVSDSAMINGILNHIIITAPINTWHCWYWLNKGRSGSLR